MFNSPSFIEELRTLVAVGHDECEDWGPIRTDILTKDIIQFIHEQLEIERRRR
jgi:hypothetical protein